MARVPPVDPDTLTDAQQKVAQAIGRGPRGKVGGPFKVLLHRPEVADATQALGLALRFHGMLDAREREFMILAVAAHWACGYEWDVHVAEARSAGLAETDLDWLRRGEGQPSPDLDLPYRFVSGLVRGGGAVDEPLYQDALRRWGREALVEVVALVGYYTMLAFTLNAHEVSPP